MSRIVQARKVDPLDKADKISAKATNLFEQAAIGLRESNGILESVQSNAQAEIQNLQDRVKAAESRKKANDKVIAKLADFVVVE